MNNAATYYLKNGLCILHIFNEESQVVHCGLLMKAGTRDEPMGKEGLAHFIEHSLFKGTNKRKSFHILNRLEVVGGELNAYTTKEETCVHASVMGRYFERAAELISDIVFNSIFPQKEIEKEKDVIIDEIRSYQDTPYEQIFDDFEGQLFKGHSLGHPILGTEDSVRNFKRRDLVDFTKSNYDPSEMVFAVSGNIDRKSVMAVADQYFGCYKSGKKERLRKPFKKYKPQSFTQKRPVNQVHYMMGRPAFGLEDPRRFTLVLFNNLLGGPGMNSRLNLNIREKYGFTYTIESGYHTYTDTGIFHIYFATDVKHYSRTKELLEKEIRKICDERLSPTRFRQYREQMIGQIELVQENRLSVMLSLAKSQLNLGRFYTLEEVRKLFEQIDAGQIREVANEILDPSLRSELIYHPL